MYENARKIMLPATHRSGHHAIGVWILHQAEGVDEFNIRTIAEWWNYLKVKDGMRFLFNNPLKHWQGDKSRFHSIMKGIWDGNMTRVDDCDPKDIEMFIGTHEQETLKEVIWHAGKSDIFYKSDVILVVRSFYNWIASCLKYSRNLEERQSNWVDPFGKKNINVYIDHCKHIMDGTVPYILYDEWFVSKQYRKEIAEYLGLPFTDAGINQTSPWGAGSSFDGFNYLKNASEMNVLNRYKQMEDDEEYQKILQENEEAINLSNQLFGKVS